MERLQRKRGESKGGHDLLDDTDPQGTDAADAAAEAAEGTGTQASSCRGFYLWEYMAVH